MFKTLREFRRSGVDRDEATRSSVNTLNEELVKMGQTFGRNVRDDVRSVKLEPKDLEARGHVHRGVRQRRPTT